MSLFKRRNNTPSLGLPPEVQAYSQAERRERMGMAWLVGLVSLLVVLMVLTGLFFGGRWLYRQVAQSDKTDTAQVVKPNETDKPKAKKPESKKPDTSATSSDHTDVPVQAPAPAPVATTPKTGDDSTELVHTGPDIDL